MKPGAAAEDRALDYLQQQRLRLITRNWRCRSGELDLVMQDGDTVVIVEVRERQRADFGSALESVDARKQRKLLLATRLFLAQRLEFAECDLRFDIVTLDGAGRLDWLRHAFEATEST